MTQELDMLVELTRTLGQPANEYVIIGEGNTSYRVGDDYFWIKASGQQMHGINADGFVAVNFEPILKLLDTPGIDTETTKRISKEAMLDQNSKVIPSVEVTFHAALLWECGVRCIAHTHPIAINRLMCSTRAEQFAKNRMFPDEVVLCGPQSAFVPYVDPGLPLAVALRDEARRYIDQWGEPPKVLLMANHGLIALAQTPKEALNITAMCVKAAHIFAGACMVGDVVFMSEADITHIYKRPDEIYRRKQFVG